MSKAARGTYELFRVVLLKPLGRPGATPAERDTFCRVTLDAHKARSSDLRVVRLLEAHGVDLQRGVARRPLKTSSSHGAA